MKPLTTYQKFRSFIIITAGGLASYSVFGFLKNDEQYYRNILMPVVRLMEPEDSHRFAIFAAKYRLLPRSNYQDPDSLRLELFGKTFDNPIGIAAGFDKNGEAITGLHDLGFGYIEIGSITPLPQDGNKKPRIFRLMNDRAVINRYGFNNDGHEAVLERLQRLRETNFNGIIGVNLGKNKTSPNAIDDYVKGIKRFGKIADYLVINISSPNTPGLRGLQDKKALTELLTECLKARNNLEGDHKPPLLIKLAPDLNDYELVDIAEIIVQKQYKIDGLIISNTTIERPDYLTDEHRYERGGLSGFPVKKPSTKMINKMYKLTQGSIPIIGVGGIMNGEDAYEKIRNGASILQIYTGLVFDGPPIVARIKRELADLLEKDNFNHVTEAVGVDV